MNETDRNEKHDHSPVLLSTQGRKVLVALATVLVSLLIAVLPELEGLEDELVSIVVVIFVTGLGLYRVVSIFHTKKQDQARREELKDLIEETVEELMDAEQRMSVPPATENTMPFDHIERTSQR